MSLNHSIQNFIEKLQAKPDHQKKAIQMLVSLGVTGGICAAWLLNMFLGGGSAVVAEKSKAPSPIGAFKEGVGTVFEAVQDTVSDTKAMFKN